ncbi:MAG: hypothetical protein AB8B91_08615 [Rubripirellula sp.]
MRFLTLLTAVALAALLIDSGAVQAQGMPLPSVPVPKVASNPETPPSMQNSTLPRQGNANRTGGQLGQYTTQVEVPRDAGQESRVYDLRPYTGYLTQHDHPEQAIVDWILRETGTDVWFTQPFGYFNASRDQLKVYHTNEMHQVVNGVVERFVAGEKDPQVMHLRVMTVGNPNWRSRAHTLMQHVTVDSPGVQAWLLSKENAALVLNMLRQRSDARQIQDLDLITHNGQTEKLASTRGRNFVRNVRPAANTWPPYEPETGEVQEGYRLSLSPLLSVDGSVIDCVVKAEIDQVDKLNPVDLELPLPNNQIHRTRIEVPQVVSWRLHERFRWPADMVLLLSCGVVASPERDQSVVPLLNMSMLTGTTAGRADALMFVEFRGRATENLTTTSRSAAAPQISAQPGGANRGRY